MKKRLLPNVVIFFFGLALLVAVPWQVEASTPARHAPYLPAVAPDLADWPMYGHDPQRTNYNPAEIVINVGNVMQLVQRWQANVGNNGIATSAAPSVTGGMLYVASSAASPNSNFFVFEAQTGAQAWAENIGYRNSCFNVGIGSTPAITGTMIVVGEDNAASNPAYHGINTINGSVVWTNTMSVGSSGFPWASALNIGNRTYVGIASRCDNPSVRGEIRELDVNTGALLANQYFVNAGGEGGGIWNSPTLSPDGSTIAVGTGEDFSCSDCSLTRSMVTLDASTLAILQHHQEPSPNNDLDFGTTPVFFHDSQGRTLVAAGHKNGTFYAYDIATLNAGAIWTRSGGTSVGLMPAYDPNFGSGGTLFIVNGSITAVDPANGNVRWGPVSIPSSHGNIAIANGLIFVNVGSGSLQIRDETNGTLLRTLPLPNAGSANSGVAVSNGFIYWLSGSYINAWSLPAGSVTPTNTPSVTHTPTVTNTPPTNTPTTSRTPTNVPCTSTPTGTVPATPRPCAIVNNRLFLENFNAGTLGAFTSTTVLTNTGGWTPAVDSVTCFTDYSAFAPDPPSVSDQRLTLRNAISIPSNYTAVYLQFAQTYGFEQVGNQNMDGGVLELSTDGGATWFDAGPYMTFGGYNGTITRTGAVCSGGITPPFTNGQSAWVGANTINTTVNLQQFTGMSILFRFRLGSDCAGGSTGWRVDDVIVFGTYVNACTPSVTRTTGAVSGTPTRTTTVTYTSTSTPTSTPTNTPTITPGGPTSPPTNSPTGTATITPGGPTSTDTRVVTPETTLTSTPTLTPTACPLTFTDVPQGSTFYVYVRCLACLGIVNGYSDGTFRPNNNVTRGQLSKIVSNSAGFSDPQTTQMFQDQPVGSTFYTYTARLASRGYISGYPCGGTGEPCVPPGSLPYFRPNNNATRGQITKIVSNAAGFIDPPAGQIFEDVPPGSTFYTYTQRLASRGVMQGYPCGGTGEPCVPPVDRPYFRPFNNATRGQTSKIVANTFFPDCDPPRRR